MLKLYYGLLAGIVLCIDAYAICTAIMVYNNSSLLDKLCGFIYGGLIVIFTIVVLGLFISELRD